MGLAYPRYAVKQFKICCLFGTRPEIIKMAPVIHALHQHTDKVSVHVVCSGQHRELLLPLIEWFDIQVHTNLDVMQANQDLNSLSAKVIDGFGELFKHEKYDFVIGQGDTTTVLMSALAAFHAKIPYGHVEAGLRTFDYNFPFPEEMNRVLVGKLASLHFAPTQTSANNLLNEKINADSILVTGNTVIDALYYTVNKLGLNNKDNDAEKTILVTAHRRENWGQPLECICLAILTIAENNPNITIVFPVHPNPNVRETVNRLLGNKANIHLCDPLPYDQLVGMLAKSYLVITDSGGLQEEAPALHKPVLVLREETERPEVVKLGGAYLVGNDTKRIIEMTEKLLNDKAAYNNMILAYSPYGTGNAAELITARIIDYLTGNGEHNYGHHTKPQQLNRISVTPSTIP
jgi:UDP-N-acetylglucosamine 2-epimerase (non-hydrolysing)